MFTVNCREAFRTPTIGRRFFRWLYEKTKLPLVPIYGGFPVKLKTYLGAPIHFKPGLTVDDVRNEVKEIKGTVPKSFFYCLFHHNLFQYEKFRKKLFISDLPSKMSKFFL